MKRAALAGMQQQRYLRLAVVFIVETRWLEGVSVRQRFVGCECYLTPGR